MSLEYQIGQVVYSKSGHDQGDVQMICAIEGEYLLLADGRRRKLEKPKRKKKKHVQPTFYVEKDLAAKLQTGISSGCRYQEGIEKVPAGTRCLMFKEVYGLV